MLLYADDIVFLATSAHELQKLISGFSEFCDLKGLTVNLTKTQVVVFTTERVAEQPIADITFKGSPVEQVEEPVQVPRHSVPLESRDCAR